MIIDLTHTLRNEIPVYPGTLEPTFKEGNTFEKDGFTEIHMSMCTHTGTHIDAPAHILKNTRSLDEFEVDKFIGSATVLDCSKLKEMSLEFLLENEQLIRDLNFVLFYTGWQDKWNTQAYFHGFPTLTQEATQWLANLKNLKGLGFDAISVDKMTDDHLPNHKILLEKEIIIIENMTNIDRFVSQKFELNCIPLKIENSDGSPIRAFGRKYENKHVRIQ